MTTRTETIELDTALKVAFATSDMKQVDQHFGAAVSFAIYTLDPEQADFSEAVQFDRPTMSDRAAAGRDPAPGGSAVPNAGAFGAPVAHRRSPLRSGMRPPDTSDHHEDKLAARIDALDGCIAVYCQAVGASAINQLLTKRIQAVKVPPGSPIKDLILDLQTQLRAGPSAWLVRAIEQQKSRDGRRFDEMELEGWVE